MTKTVFERKLRPDKTRNIASKLAISLRGGSFRPTTVLRETEAVRARATRLTNTLEVVVVQVQGNHPAFVVHVDTIPFREFRIGVPAVFSDPASPAGCPKQGNQHDTVRRSSVDGNLPRAQRREKGGAKTIELGYGANNGLQEMHD